MKIRDLAIMALRNLKSRKLRTFLTVLGVVIGVTSIIVMLSIGFGFQKMTLETYQQMGDLQTLDLKSDVFWSEKQVEDEKKAKKKKLDKTAVSEIKKVEHVVDVMPIYQGMVSLRSGRYENSWVEVIAIDPSVMESFGFKMGQGRYLDANDNKSGVVVSPKLFENFRDPKKQYDPKTDYDENGRPKTKINYKSRINLYNFNLKDSQNQEYSQNNEDQNNYGYTEKLKLVGELEYNQNDYNYYNHIIMSINYFENLVKASSTPTKKLKIPNEYNNIKVKVDEIKNLKEVQQKLKDMGYNPTNMYAEFQEQANKTLVRIQLIFGAIGAISFIVAAIGITNTMIMSIYERTKEIGVMKVIGASIKDIQKLFLTEAGIIGLFGGIVGLILSYSISFIINYFVASFANSMSGTEGAKLSYIPIWLSVVALVFSAFIGVLSGYLPARRAMKLSALDAIRSE